MERGGRGSGRLLRRWAALGSVVLGLALGIAGCSGGEDEVDGDGAETSAATPEPLPWDADPALPEPPPEADIEVVDPSGLADFDETELPGGDDPRIGRLFDLSTSDDPAAVDRVLELAFEDPVEPAVQAEALATLEDLRDVARSQAIAGAGRILRESESVVVRERAVEALEYLGTREATEVLLGALGDPSADVREAIADALEFTAGAEDLDVVKQAYEAEVDRGVRRELWEVLENIAIERQQEQKKASTDTRA